MVGAAAADQRARGGATTLSACCSPRSGSLNANVPEGTVIEQLAERAHLDLQTAALVHPLGLTSAFTTAG